MSKGQKGDRHALATAKAIQPAAARIGALKNQRSICVNK
jgi:hypothetical protein